MKIPIIKNAVNEMMDDVMDESTPPNFPKSLKGKIVRQYGKTPKAYATMWAIHNKKNEGDARINEMWGAWESKDMKNELNVTTQNNVEEHDETNMNNPEEKREVQIGNEILKLISGMVPANGQTGKYLQVEKLAKELIDMHRKPAPGFASTK